MANTTFAGKVIAALTGPDFGNTLELTFADGTSGRISDEGQSCCEHRYMNCSDDLSSFIGATIRDVVELPCDLPDEEGYEVHEAIFVHVNTDRGSIVLETHNEHNGYYGGFWVKCSLTGR